MISLYRLPDSKPQLPHTSDIAAITAPICYISVYILLTTMKMVVYNMSKKG